MANEAKKLQVDVIARIDKLEKAMTKAGRVTDGTMSKVEGRTKTMVARVDRQLAGLAKTFAGGLLTGAAAAGITGLISQVGDIAKGVASIGDEAKRAGVSMKAFQEWKFVAEQNRIGVDALTDGLKELNLRADEFVVTGKGSAAEAFQRLGYGAEDLKKKLEDPSALLLEIIGRLGKMEKAAQIRIADELFGGTAGERFVELLGQGEEGIRATIDRAHELGAVMDDELIKKAAELDKRFNEISMTVGFALKSAIVSAADSLSEFIDSFNAFDRQRNATLQSKQTQLDAQRLELENKILEVQGNQALNERARAKAISTYRAELEKLKAVSAQVEGVFADRAAKAPRVTDRAWTPPTPPAGGFGSTGSSTKSRAPGATAAERAAQQAQRDIDRAIASQTAVAVDAATQYLGMNERANRGSINSFLKSGGVDLDAATTKWCAAFVNAALAQVGVKGSGSNIATDFAKWGVNVDPSQIQRGDVLVDSNGRSAGQTGGHVGFATGLTRFSNGILQLQMLSGNASDKVQEDWIAASEVIARRATEAFKVPEGSLAGITEGARQYREEIERTIPPMEQMKALGDTFLDGVLGALADGKISTEEWLQIALQLVQQLQSLNGIQIGGGGGILSSIASLLGLKDGGIVKAATGGYIRGPGSSRSDSVPARLSNGEFVVNAASTKKHRALLEAINAGSLPGFANGGAVGMSAPRLADIPSVRGSALGGTIQLVVRAEEGQMFRPVVQAEAQGVAVKVTQAGLGQFSNQLDRTFGARMARAQQRQL